MTQQQQDQLQELIQAYRSAQKATVSNSDIQSARQSFEKAVLSGDSTGATAATDALASAMTASLPKRLEALADFEVKAVGILRPQASALQQQLGNNRLVALLESLARGPAIAPGPDGPGG